MSEFLFGYREVIPDQTLPEAWKEISLNTGGTQSTLQDIKVAEKAGGYCYRDASKHYTRNRFIYWRINNDVLELVEHSLDVNLTGNKLKYRFVDTPLLDGITIHETYGAIVILVPTVCSVHRLIFPHPDRLHKQDELLTLHPGLTCPSIFCETTASHARDLSAFYVFNNPSTASSQLPHVAASLLTLEEDAIFLLGYPSEELLLVKQLANGSNVSVELKYESIVPRFLSGIAYKFRSRQSDADVVVSMVLHSFGLETYAFTLSRDGHLRVWSCSKAQCVSAMDILAEASDSGCHLIQGGQNHVLRKAIGNNETDLILAVFMCFTSECQFHILKPDIISGMQFQITRINTLHSPGRDLVDFTLSSSRIWSLCRTEDGETASYTAVLETRKGSIWMPIILETFPDINQTLENNELDPKQAYLEYIFYPGRFPLQIISKALSIYKRSPSLSDITLSPPVLKQRVAMAVENEIQEKLKESEVSDADYLECATWCWSQFYSCCVQYHSAGLRPLGILLLPAVSGAVILKKSFFSFLRPLDALEHMMLCSDYSSAEQFIHHPLLSENLEVVDDVIHLMDAVVYVESQLSDIFKDTFRTELEYLKSPDTVMSELITEIQDEEFTLSMSEKLKNCVDIYQCMHKLLEMLRIENQVSFEVEEGSDYGIATSMNHLFSSQLGVSMVVQCLQQQAQIRFAICRNLLMVNSLLLRKSDQDWNSLEAIRSVCSPEIVVLTQASFALLYFSDLPSIQSTPSEFFLQRLSPLRLAPVFNIKKTLAQSIFLLEHFIASTGGSGAYKKLVKSCKDEDDLTHWHISLLSYVGYIASIIWPISSNATFAEWLLASGQHLWLQQYVRLLNNWCEWNICTRNFLLAVMFLSSGEYYKAQDLFLDACKGIFTDKFLAEHILTSSEFRSPERAPLAYFLKVIQLFELHGAKDCALNVAKTALTIANKEDPLVATLHSIKFIHHLSLGHYERAYDSLNSNPDPDRRKDNLRDLVKILLDKKKIDILMSFPYADMEELFCSILFTRARATDTIDNVYYDCLYAYQIKRGTVFMRLAASIMYEQAFRLNIYNTVEALEKQVKCYLAAINALYLCDPLFAWIVKPADPDLEVEEVLWPPLAGSEEPIEKFTIRKEIEVIGIEEVKKELEFTSSRLKLVRFDPSQLTSHLISSSELVIILSSIGLFKYALSLCTTLQLSYAPVFEHLTRQCVLLMEYDEPTAWNWLIENDIHDLSVVGKSSAVVAWALLEHLLEEYEEENMSILHKVVCTKIIKLGMYIPHWLWSSYKKRNPAELLRLLHGTGRLDEAIALSKDLLLAALGHGREHFNFKHSLMHGAPQFCLPIHSIDSLLYELELQNSEPDKPFEKEYEMLKEIFVKYVETSTRITNEMAIAKYSPIIFKQ